MGGAEALRQQAISDALPDLYARAVVDTEVDPIAAPEIDITSGEAGGPLTFDALVEVRPTVSVAGYGGLVVTVPGIDVTDEEIDAQIDRVREQSGELEVVNRPAHDGDFMTIDLHGTRTVGDDLDVQDYLYEVGSGSDIAGLDDQLRGSTVGDILQFSADIPGPDDTDAAHLVPCARERRQREGAARGQRRLGGGGVGIRHGRCPAQRPRPRSCARSRSCRPRWPCGRTPWRRWSNWSRTIRPSPSSTPRCVNDFTISVTGSTRGTSPWSNSWPRRAGTGPACWPSCRPTPAGPCAPISLCGPWPKPKTWRSATPNWMRAVADMAEQAGTTGADLRRRLDRAGRLPAVRSDQRKAKALEWLIDHVALVDEEGKPVDRDDLLPDPVMQAEGNDSTTGDVDTTSDGQGERGSEDVRAEEGATVEAEA